MESEVSQEDRRSIYAAVARIVAADGSVSAPEREFLEVAREKLHLDPAEADEIRLMVWGGKFEASIPATDEARQMMLDLVTQAAQSDGEVQPAERRALDLLAERLDLSTGPADGTASGQVSLDLGLILDALRGPRPVRSLWRLGPRSVGIVAVNLWVLFAILFFGWDVYVVLLAYWAENVLIGFYRTIEVLLAQEGLDEDAPFALRPTSVLYAAFFGVSWALFACLHGLIVVGLFGPTGLLRGSDPFASDLHLVHSLVSSFTPPVLGAVLFMLLAHGYSFFAEYIGRGEYVYETPAHLASEPWGRVVVVHLALIIGTPLWVLLPRLFAVVLVPLKMGLDLRSYMLRQGVVVDDGGSPVSAILRRFGGRM